jgi:hypothetical protein
VSSRYLQLPDGLPDRVLVLARGLTATGPTPYDRALAIRDYLRRFPYTLDLPAPPPGRDVVDYFLFDLQRGYCDYFATAMVVLARAAGVPARLAVGYASGLYDPLAAHYVVTEANAHAWVEVYFPGYGWVEFEPTAGYPAIDRGGEAGGSDWRVPEGELGCAEAWWAGLDWPWWKVSLWGLGLLVLVVALLPAADAWRLRRMKPSGAVGVLYNRVRRRGKWAGAPSSPGDTPYEFQASLSSWISQLARRTGRDRVLLPAIYEARRIVTPYVRASYSEDTPNPFDQALAIEAWHRLRWRFLLARLWRE